MDSTSRLGDTNFELSSAAFANSGLRAVGEKRRSMDFSGVSILCIGDLMLDRFAHGTIERISPEAPVPVVHLRYTREMLGGAGNVANNVASLGGQATLVGLLSVDQPGIRFRQIVASIPGITIQAVDTQLRPTICKTRLIAAGQQVIRTDEESDKPLDFVEEEELVKAIVSQADGVDAIILSDYGKGVLSQKIIEQVIVTGQRRGTAIFVDPKGDDFSRYHGATCITPNLKELSAATGMSVDSEDAIVSACRKLIAEAKVNAILATRSEKGMTLVEASGTVHSIPSRAREVFDVSGAGDTVVATMALAYASGRTLSQSMHIANAAAGVAVGKLGTATVEVSEVIEELEKSDHIGDTGSIEGVVPWTRVQTLVSLWRHRGLRIAPLRPS